jgi:hypothetical protein
MMEAPPAHAADGLTENDFILAAKIDTLPVALKTRIDSSFRARAVSAK